MISQDPKSGTAPKGATITLIRSSRAGDGDGPNVSRGWAFGRRRQVMKDAGFKTKVRPVAVNYIGVGFVVYSTSAGLAAGAQGLDDHPVRGLSGGSRGQWGRRVARS